MLHFWIQKNLHFKTLQAIHYFRWMLAFHNEHTFDYFMFSPKLGYTQPIPLRNKIYITSGERFLGISTIFSEEQSSNGFQSPPSALLLLSHEVPSTRISARMKKAGWKWSVKISKLIRRPLLCFRFTRMKYAISILRMMHVKRCTASLH